MAKSKIVTLTTDYGIRDGYVASIKGVLLSMASHIQIVDVTHHIPPQNVLIGAFVLNQVISYFPPGTIHIVVVDPEVGTQRRILAARYGGQMIVAPDNGLVTLVDSRLPLEGMASVNNAQTFLERRVGATFDGRDVMAPVAAALANGLEISKLGPPPATYKLLDLPQTAFDGHTLSGQVIYTDNFGNCITNITAVELRERMPNIEAVNVRAGAVALGGVQGAYAHVNKGEPLVLLNSMDLLEIALNGGNATDTFGLGIGAPVQITSGK